MDFFFFKVKCKKSGNIKCWQLLLSFVCTWYVWIWKMILILGILKEWLGGGVQLFERPLCVYPTRRWRKWWVTDVVPFFLILWRSRTIAFLTWHPSWCIFLEHRNYYFHCQSCSTHSVPLTWSGLIWRIMDWLLSQQTDSKGNCNLWSICIITIF